MERGGSSWYGGHGTLRGRVDGSEEEHTTTLPEGTMEETRGLASPGSGEATRKVHTDGSREETRGLASPGSGEATRKVHTDGSRGAEKLGWHPLRVLKA